MSSFEAATGDIVFDAKTGAAKIGMEELRREFNQTTGSMSTDALRAAVAQEKLDKTIARHGPASTQAKAATVAYRRELSALAAESEVASTQIGSSVAAFTRQGTAAREAETSLGRFTRGSAAAAGVSGELRRALLLGSTAFLGGYGLVHAIKAATDAAIEHQATEAQLGAAVRAAGIDYTAYAGQIDDALKSLQQLSGFSEEDTSRAFTKMVRNTKDVGKALEYTSLAARIARGANIQLTAASMVVVKALSGQTTGLRRLGVALPAGVSGFKALQIAAEKFGGSLDAYSKTAAGSQARLAIAIHQTEVAIGTALLPAVTHLSNEITTWLNNTHNQEKIQRDVNAAVREGTSILKGLVEAERLIAPPIHLAIDALGGFEHAVEVALIVGVLAKTKRAAASFGLIQVASAKTAAVVVADSAVEGGAIEGVGAKAAVTAGEVAGIGTAAAGAAGVVAGLGGRLATTIGKAGELAAVLAGLDIATSKHVTRDSGINRYSGSGGFGNLLHDSLYAVSGGLINTGIGKPPPNDTGPATLRASDVVAAIQDGSLTLSGLAALKSRFASPEDYTAAVNLAKYIAGAGGGNAASALTGGASTSVRPLSDSQKLAVGLAAHPDDTSLLAQQATNDRAALDFLDKQRAAGKITNKDYVAKTKAYQSDLVSTEQTIKGINDAAAAARKAAAGAAKSAADEAKRAAAERARAYAEAVKIRGDALKREVTAAPLGPKRDVREDTLVRFFMQEADDAKLSASLQSHYATLATNERTKAAKVAISGQQKAYTDALKLRESMLKNAITTGGVRSRNASVATKGPASKNSDIIDETFAAFPGLAKYRDLFVFKQSGASPQGYQSESYQKGETESFDRSHRAIELFGTKNKPEDVAGEIVSHFLARGTDPALTKAYNQFVKTITPGSSAMAFLKRDFNRDDGRTFKQYEQLSGIPALFRGSLFNQLDSGDVEYTKAQQKIFARVKAILKSGGPGSNGAPGITTSNKPGKPAAVKIETPRAQAEDALVTFYKQEASDAKLSASLRSHYAALARSESDKARKGAKKDYDDALKLRESVLKLAVAKTTTLPARTKAQDALVEFYKQELNDMHLTRLERAKWATKLEAEQHLEDKQDAARKAKAKKQAADRLTLARSEREQALSNALAVAGLHETQAGTNTKRLAAARAEEEKALQGYIKFYEGEEKDRTHLTALERLQARSEELTYRQQLAALKNSSTTTAQSAGDIKTAFLDDVKNIIGSYAPNFFAAPTSTGGSKTDTHLFEAVHELRQIKGHLSTVVSRDKWPGSRYGQTLARSL